MTAAKATQTAADVRQLIRVWPALFLAHGAGACAAVVVLAAALGVPLARIGVPCVLVAACGVIVPGLLIWVRQAHGNPRRAALRTAVASFVYLQQLAIALGLSAISLELTSARVLITQYAPILDVLLLALAIWIYLAVRRRGSLVA